LAAHSVILSAIYFWGQPLTVDNYLSLIPGEKRTLKCVVPQQVAEVESVTLTVSGWNVPEKKIKLFLDGMK